MVNYALLFKNNEYIVYSDIEPGKPPDVRQASVAMNLEMIKSFTIPG